MPNLHLVGVAMDDRDILEGNAEALRHELREGRLVALAVAVRAGQHLDRADRIDAHFRRFPLADAAADRADDCRRRKAAGLDIGGKADRRAACPWRRRPPCARRRPCSRQAPEPCRASRRNRPRHRRRRHRRLVRERRDEIGAAEFGGVAPQFARRDLDDALDDESRLRASGAAIGVDRRGIGVDRVDLAIDRRNIAIGRTAAGHRARSARRAEKVDR